MTICERERYFLSILFTAEGHNVGPSTIFEVSGLFNTEPSKRAGMEGQFLEKCTRVIRGPMDKMGLSNDLEVVG
jgi:hypothetical protein